MEDDRLGDLLRELPREQARPGFTARTLARLDGGPRRRHPAAGRRLAFAAATALTLAVAAGAVANWRHEAADAERARRTLAEIRAQHESLRQELREVSEPSLLYLGGDGKVDYVLDLDQVGDAPITVTAAGAVPAAYREDTY